MLIITEMANRRSEHIAMGRQYPHLMHEHIKIFKTLQPESVVSFSPWEKHHLGSCLEPEYPNLDKALESGGRAATVTAEYRGLKALSIKQSPQTYA